MSINYTFASFPPVLTEKNNRVLSAPRSMPFKDANSSGDTMFSTGRSVYMRSLDLTITRSDLSDSTRSVIEKKKFYGGTNRDASAIVNRKRNYTIGLATTNENGVETTFS